MNYKLVVIDTLFVTSICLKSVVKASQKRTHDCARLHDAVKLYNLNRKQACAAMCHVCLLHFWFATVLWWEESQRTFPRHVRRCFDQGRCSISNIFVYHTIVIFSLFVDWVEFSFIPAWWLFGFLPSSPSREVSNCAKRTSSRQMVYSTRKNRWSQRVQYARKNLNILYFFLDIGMHICCFDDGHETWEGLLAGWSGP